MRDELQQLPGVGPSIAADLRRLGVKSVRGLGRRNPERLYARLCEMTGTRQDPCVLYTFRCAVYAARTGKPDPELLKWWKWVSAGSKPADLMSAGPRERRHRGESRRDERRDKDVAAGPPVQQGLRNRAVLAGPKAKQGRVAQRRTPRQEAAAGTGAEQESEVKRRRLRGRTLTPP